MSHIFISYSKKDREYARKLADKLLAEGFDVWIDDRIDYGDDWELAIFKAIDNCAAFVVVMTPDSYESKWVRRECHYAEKRDKPPFPVLLGGEEFPRYGITQYVNVKDGSLPQEDFFNRLEKWASRKSTPGKEVIDRAAATQEDTTVGEGLRPFPTSQTPPKLIFPDVSAILPPPFEWCEIPAGKVVIKYGFWQFVRHRNDQIYIVEKQENFNIKEAVISKFLVTTEQYQTFADASDGYCLDLWWSFSTYATEWRKRNPAPIENGFKGDNLPRTNVTWYEAIAFCNWLTAKLRGQSNMELVITLPSEQQWQRAAQGDDDRDYPWGSYFDTALCNTKASSVCCTSPVTQYSRGISPFGIYDMAGNVWEWTLSEWTNGNVDIKRASPRTVRGGSWEYEPTYAQVLTRYFNDPASATKDVGFRVALM